jgi:hypothetical protein
MPVTPPVEEVGEGPRELPGVGVVPGVTSLVDRGEQDGVLVGEPGQRPPVVGKVLGDGTGSGGVRMLGSRCGYSSRAAA